MKKLEYFNSMHIRNRFDQPFNVEKWRAMLIDYLPEDLHLVISNFDSVKLEKIMDLMKIRIHFFHDMA